MRTSRASGIDRRDLVSPLVTRTNNHTTLPLLEACTVTLSIFYSPSSASDFNMHSPFAILLLCAQLTEVRG